MSATVFANGNGLFHAGSNGSGTAFPDVCLSPPPPPAGPIPIPYPNRASASDLADGSTTVSIEGNPTALKDKSYVKTTSGDEGGTQGGGVITHKTKGKAYFKFWSFDVKIEGLNVDTHGDPMGQNCPSSTLNGVCLRSSVVRAAWNAAKKTKCTVAYDNDTNHVEPNSRQTQQAKAEHTQTGGQCWECKQKCTVYDDDHFPPLCVLWYAGGCNMTEDQWKDAAKKVRCRPHCKSCSAKQSGTMKKLNNAMKKII